MTGFAIALLALAVADLAAGGISGTVVSRRRMWLAIIVATASAAGLALVAGLPTAQAVLLTMLVGSGTLPWLWLRLHRVCSSLALTVHATWIALLVGLGSIWTPAESTALGTWLATSPFFRSTSQEQALLVASQVAYLAATGNALVRAVLSAATVDLERPSQSLRGGRAIGVVERWLILGLVLGGESTAAAVIVSAKSLLRFPEIADRQRNDQIDSVTEYVVVGSLVSWALALASALLVASMR